MIARLATFFLLVSTNAQKDNFCRTSDGAPGKCLGRNFCTNRDSSCGPNLVCCPMMEKIVTPDVVAPFPNVPIAPQVPVFNPVPVQTTSTPIFQPIPSKLPFPTIRPQVPTSNSPMVQIPVSSAVSHCEEYKHRVKKRASIMPYVFGGTASQGKEFPHMAILGYGNPEKPDWLCGGSLISNQFILTAAHCLMTSNLGQLIRVRLGELNLQTIDDDARPQDYGVARIIPHPNYHPPSQYDDIGLIQLDRPVQFDDYISPICVEVNRNLPSSNFIATGWGRTELGGLQSDVLMKVGLEYFPNDVCRRNYEAVAPESLSKGILDEMQICAGSYRDDKDTCQGDSGGPLQIRNDVLYLVGITSFGKACGVPNSPGVYTRVSYYVPWIESIVWPY